MSYYSMLLEVARKSKEVFSGYCRNMEYPECVAKLTTDISKAFVNYSIPVEPFLNYSLYAMEKQVNFLQGEPVFIGEVDLKYVKLDMSQCKGNSVRPPFNNSIPSWIFKQPDCSIWPMSMNVGLFYPSSSPSKSGVFSYSPDMPTLGILNYGYFMNGEEYIFNDGGVGGDPECEDTTFYKADSLYSGKFNCVYGQKYAEEVDEIEIYSVRNPGFEKEEVFFTGPRIRERPLYNHPGKFYNKEKVRYGVPLTPKEQSILFRDQILERLAEFCRE